MIVQAARGKSEYPGGQSLVEFALILPLLLVLLLGIADLGRVFTSAIASEAAARNAAEAAAQEYLQLSQRSGGLSQSDYQDLHDRALEVACREAERLPSRIVDILGNCTMPHIAVCVHDDAEGDTNTCGQESVSAPAECTEMSAGWSAARSGPIGGRPYVEVRFCYRFDPIIVVPFGNWGSIWLQKANIFAVTNY